MSRFISFEKVIAVAMFGTIHISLIQLLADTYVDDVSKQLKKNNAPSDAFIPINEWRQMDYYNKVINMPKIWAIEKN